MTESEVEYGKNCEMMNCKNKREALGGLQVMVQFLVQSEIEVNIGHTHLDMQSIAFERSV